MIFLAFLIFLMWSEFDIFACECECEVKYWLGLGVTVLISKKLLALSTGQWQRGHGLQYLIWNEQLFYS